MVQYALPLTGVVAVEIVARKHRRRRIILARVDWQAAPENANAKAIARVEKARRRITVGRLDLYALTGGECVRLPGACIHVACRHNLAVVDRTEQHKKATPRAQTESQCSIREAADGAMTGAKVAGILGLCDERVRQIEVEAFAKIAASAPELREAFEAVWARPDGQTYPVAVAGDDEDDGRERRRRVDPTGWR